MRFFKEMMEEHKNRKGLRKLLTEKKFEAGFTTLMILAMAGFGYFTYLDLKEVKKSKEKFDGLRQELFSRECADKNEPYGYIDYNEQIDAYLRMGYGPFFETEKNKKFPEPKLEELQRAIDSYRSENGKSCRSK